MQVLGQDVMENLPRSHGAEVNHLVICSASSETVLRKESVGLLGTVKQQLIVNLQTLVHKWPLASHPNIQPTVLMFLVSTALSPVEALISSYPLPFPGGFHPIILWCWDSIVLTDSILPSILEGYPVRNTMPRTC